MLQDVEVNYSRQNRGYGRPRSATKEELVNLDVWLWRWCVQQGDSKETAAKLAGRAIKVSQVVVLENYLLPEAQTEPYEPEQVPVDVFLIYYESGEGFQLGAFYLLAGNLQRLPVKDLDFGVFF